MILAYFYGGRKFESFFDLLLSGLCALGGIIMMADYHELCAEFP